MRHALLPAVVFLLAAGIPGIAASEPVPASPDIEIIGGLPAVTPAENTVPRIITQSGGLCSGSFLSAEWVLTAAHCVEARATIFTGSLTAGGLISAGGASGFAHPLYAPLANSIRYDFGLYRLDVPYAAAVPVRLAAYDETWASTAGTVAVSTGWGVTSAGGSVTPQLLTGSMSVVGDASCADLDTGIGNDFDMTTSLCTMATGVSSCNGDSGGPVFAIRPDAVVQIGVTSYGPQFCNGHSVAGLVPSALTWIRSETGLAIGGPALSPALPRTTRFFGVDRYETGAAVGAFWGTSPTVFITTGQNFPDSLAAGAAAGRFQAPVLLVTPTSVPLPTRLLLRILRPSTIYVAGGTAAVSDAVVAELQALTGASIIRNGGADRYATAELFTRLAWPTPAGVPVWIASGRDFKDPLIASSAAAVYVEPFVLIDGLAANLSAANRALLTSLGPTMISLVGPAGSFSPTMLAELATIAPLEVFDHPDVSVRSISVWSSLPSSPSVSLATSANFPDALSAVPLSALPPARALILVPGTCVPAAVTAELARLQVTDIALFGGPAAISIASEGLAPC